MVNKNDGKESLLIEGFMKNNHRSVVMEGASSVTVPEITAE